MDISSIKATNSLVLQYSDQAVQSFESRRKKILNLINEKSCPECGWSDEEIEILLHEIAMMDSNNFFGSAGVGEREARFASRIVARRHYYMGHGIGRSGDITEIQPKAAGSSLIGQLANYLALDLLRSMGVPSLQKCIIVPLATGMSLMLCLRTLQSNRPNSKYVIWPRIDQKSCFKCILTAGLIPIIVPNEIIGDRIIGSCTEITNKIQSIGSENIVCVLSTTSSFAPKEPDNILEISKVCKNHDIPLLVNNAYGIQCRTYLRTIEKVSKTRLDLFVSSTDKNFMVPVGGSLICGFDVKVVDNVGKMYPGRGSGTPSTDIFITLLNIGKKGYKNLITEREEMYAYLKKKLSKVASDFDEKVLEVPNNNISIACSLAQFESLHHNTLTEIGSMLFSKFIMGARVVSHRDVKNIGGYEFKNWGSHTDEPFVGYLTASAAIGIKKEDIDTFIKHLRKVLTKVRKDSNQRELVTYLKNQ